MEEEEGDAPGVRPTAAAFCLPLWEYDVSACGLLGGRETKKLFGRRIWRATDECLADATAADDGGGRQMIGGGGKSGERACSPSVEPRAAT